VWDENADSLLSALIRICHCYPKAHANLGKLVDDFKQASTVDKRARRRCRLQRFSRRYQRDEVHNAGPSDPAPALQKEARLRGRDFGWYEDLGDRPEAKLFAVAMQRCSLQEQADRTTVVSDFAMEITMGQWRKHSITGGRCQGLDYCRIFAKCADAWT